MTKRISRKTPQSVREKISAALRRYHAENPASEVTRAKISAAMKAYWATIPNCDPAAEQPDYNFGENIEKK